MSLMSTEFPVQRHLGLKNSSPQQTVGESLRGNKRVIVPAPDLTHAEKNIYSKLAKVNDPAYTPSFLLPPHHAPQPPARFVTSR